MKITLSIPFTLAQLAKETDEIVMSKEQLDWYVSLIEDPDGNSPKRASYSFRGIKIITA